MRISAIELRAWAWLALAIGIAVSCVVQLSGRTALETNLLALLPATERNPLAEQAVTRLSDAAGNRAVFLIGHSSADTATAAARRFAKALRAAGEGKTFARVTAEVPNIDWAEYTAIYRKHRYQLLTAADAQALESASAELEGRLLRKLHAPLRFGSALSVTEDPFGLTDAWLAELPIRVLALAPSDGLLVARQQGQTWVFVSAELSGSAYDADTQQGAMAAVAQAEAELRANASADGAQVQVLRTGTVFYAAAARTSAEREFDLIGAGTVLGLLGLLYLVFRSVRPLALGLLSVAFGIGAAVAATIWIHGQLHLITLVFGASLIGEAIDYAIQYFAAHLGAGPSWEPMAGLRRIAPGLTVALATSVLGYGALMQAPFPALSQIALFALVGLSGAWVSVFLLLPALLRTPSKRDPQAAVRTAQRFLQAWRARMSRTRCVALGLVLLLAAVPGWFTLSGNDDIRLLIDRPAALTAQEAQIRALTGLANSGQFFLVEGASQDEVLEREQRLTQRLRALAGADQISGYQSLSAFVPSASQQSRNRSLWQARVFGDEPGFSQTLAAAGLRGEIAAQQIAAFKATAGQTLRLEEWLQAPISAPFRHLWLGATANGFASLVVPQGVRATGPLVQAAADAPGVTLVDKAASVSQLFRSYRLWGGLWLLGAFVLIYGVLSCAR